MIGEPGIGKSRLIVELQKAEDIQEVTFLKGAALSIGKDLSYHPITKDDWLTMVRGETEIKFSIMAAQGP